MTPAQKLMLTAGALTAVALTSSAVMLTQGKPCGNSPVAILAAPGGRQKAVVFERGCGSAPTHTGRMVSLLAGDAKFPANGEVGNVFRMDTVAAQGRAIDVTAAWESESVLVIRHRADARVTYAVLRDRGVRIRYDTLP